MKKTVISVLCVILVFIPTFIAIASYIMTQNAPLSNGFVERIDISDFNGKTSTVTKTKSEGDLVTFFVKMTVSCIFFITIHLGYHTLFNAFFILVRKVNFIIYVGLFHKVLTHIQGFIAKSRFKFL